MHESRPLASLSLDLDNQWSYMKTHGDADWESLPSYLDIVVPRVLRLLKERNLTITFFIVGLDADQERNHNVLRSIAEAGHEIGNHSFHHEPWLHLYSQEQLVIEIAKAEASIEQATGRKPIGFRGPGFSLSSDLIELLTHRGYLYDASTFPTYRPSRTRLLLHEEPSVRGRSEGAKESIWVFLRWVAVHESILLADGGGGIDRDTGYDHARSKVADSRELLALSV